MILQKNIFVERILPGSVMRKLTDEEMDAYRKPFIEPGESRRPTLTWPRQIPFEGEPAESLRSSMTIRSGSRRARFRSFHQCRSGRDPDRHAARVLPQWPNQREVTVKGVHFIQEDSPHEIGATGRLVPVDRRKITAALRLHLGT